MEINKNYLWHFLLFVGILFLYGCTSGKKTPKLDERGQDKYSIVTPDGRKIVYSPVDSLLVVEFSADVSKDQKREIINEFNLKLLPIRHWWSMPIQTIEDSTLVLGTDKEESIAIRTEMLKKYPDDIKGMLPAFSHKDSKRPPDKPIFFLIVYFKDNVSFERRKEIVAKLDYPFLSVNHREGEGLIIFGITKKDSALVHQKLLQKHANEIERITFHENYIGPYYLSPTTFSITFYHDVPQDSVSLLLKRHNLSIPNDWIEEHFYPYYVMRMVTVIIPKHEDLFKKLRSLYNESNVYSVTPIKSAGHLATRFSLSKSSKKYARNVPAYINKIGRNLQNIYWLWKTAPIDIVKKFANQGAIEMIKDSIKVDISLQELKIEEVYQFLGKRGVRPISTINDGGDKWSFSGLLKLEDFENFVAHEEVLNINISKDITIGGEPIDIEKLPPPPP